jgi:transcriptional regulator with XRE-family HTH domain
MNSQIKDRLKEVRNQFNISQKELGKKTDIGQSTIAMFETGDRFPKDIHIKRICSEFNINEEWLRTGKGEMFRPQLEEDEFTAQVMDYVLLADKDDEIRKLIVGIMRTYTKLDDKGQKFLRKIIRDVADNMSKEE